jgi:hypothetical protein
MQNNGCIYTDKINSTNIKNCHTLLDYYLNHYPHSTREEWIEKIRCGYIVRVCHAGVDQKTGIFVTSVTYHLFFFEN